MSVWGLGKAIGLGCASALLLTNVASAECVKRNPVLGVDILVDDANCPPAKKPTPAPAATAKPKPAATAVAKPATAAKPATKAAGDPEVKQLQQLLAKAGYKPGPATGVMNDKTREAGYAFKKKYGLKAGTDAEETIEALQEVLAGKRKPPVPKPAAAPAPAPAKAATPAPAVAAAAAPVVAAAAPAAVSGPADPETKELQTLLSAVGYDAGPATGLMNEQTKNAAYAFKKSNGLKAGTDAEETIEVLKRISGR